MQNWKTNKKLYDCKRNEDNQKMLNYDQYVKDFMGEDPVKDWESINNCINLFNFFKSKINLKYEKILDAGTKDGQMTAYLNGMGYDAIGIEIDDTYVKYAQSKNRNVIKGNICDMKFEDNSFDVIFSHHVLGLCPNYTKAYQEMLRVVKPNGYIVTLNDIKGNPRKHYSLINSPNEVTQLLLKCHNHKVIYFDWWKDKPSKEFVVILQKIPMY